MEGSRKKKLVGTLVAALHPVKKKKKRMEEESTQDKNKVRAKWTQNREVAEKLFTGQKIKGQGIK